MLKNLVALSPTQKNAVQRLFTSRNPPKKPKIESNELEIEFQNKYQEAKRLLNAIKLQEPSWLDKMRAELKTLSLMPNTNSVANIVKLKNQPDTAITVIDLTEEDQATNKPLSSP